MMKLESLRKAFLASPLHIRPETLLTFAEKGTLHSWRGSANQAYRIDYTANVIVTGFGGATQDLFFVALDWLHTNCPGADEDALKFHVDIIDHKSADVSIAIDLTEIIATETKSDGMHIVSAVDPDADAIGMAAFFPDLKADSNG